MTEMNLQEMMCVKLYAVFRVALRWKIEGMQYWTHYHIVGSV